MDILIPDYYVSSTSERIKLYKELDEIKDENSLSIFKINLEDRFAKFLKKQKEFLN